MLHVMGLQVVGEEDVLYFCLLAILLGMEILVPWPGIGPTPPAVEAQSSSHWTTMEFFWFIFIFKVVN